MNIKWLKLCAQLFILAPIALLYRWTQTKQTYTLICKNTENVNKNKMFKLRCQEVEVKEQCLGFCIGVIVIYNCYE